METPRDLKFEMMANYPPCLAALKKLKESPPGGFAFFEFEWLDGGKADVMKVTGTCFREAQRGKRKGQRVIPIEGTKVVVYVTQSEINAEDPRVVYTTQAGAKAAKEIESGDS